MSSVSTASPDLFICGELHPPRIPRAYWRHRLECARAMGLNTVCLYLFWNHHETAPGHFDFSGEKDMGAFCEIAAELGLAVILRPGPYSCAEWDGGGLPAWLLVEAPGRLRSSAPEFFKPARRYLKRVGRHLARYQKTRGGPIVMVQVENEYGCYGNDRTYMRGLRDTLREAGFEVPLMRCDWAWSSPLTAGQVDDDVVLAVNFGSKPAENFASARAWQPGKPLMCGEYWMGWFDWYGQPRNGGDPKNEARQIEDIRTMLAERVSFSLYMFHGGTSFGFSAGANGDGGKYLPYVTSYDYFAPLDEQGRPRPKFFQIRDTIAAATGKTPPAPPAPLPVGKLPTFTLDQGAPLWTPRMTGVRCAVPVTMEALGQTHGCLLYRTDLAGRYQGKSKLRVTEVHDFAWVYFNGRLVGTIDRREPTPDLEIDVSRTGPALLEILVEGMGHVNFGALMNDDQKGITRRVELWSVTLFDWEHVALPLVGSSRVDLQACKLEYSIVSPK